MSISVERQGNEAIIKLGLQVDEVNKGFNKAIAKINKQVSIPGFRKGKAPRNI